MFVFASFEDKSDCRIWDLLEFGQHSPSCTGNHVTVLPRKMFASYPEKKKLFLLGLLPGNLLLQPLVFKARKHEHIKPLLQKLHWLPVVPRIQYKVATLCYNSFTESYPVYLSELLTPDNFAPFLTPEPSAYLPQKQRPLDNELFLSRDRQSGTRYRMMFVTQYQHLLSSKP